MTAPESTGGIAVPQSAEPVPAIVAVVVTCNPGSWFSETLESLRDQDYPNLSVLIIDAASTDDPLERIVQILPTAYVRRLSRNPGYAAASNRVLRILQGASYLVMCHDDIAPAPDAFRKMVEEAMRTNAGIVTPKMVEWLRPERLLALGGGADTTAAFVPAVESGDLDQGQHDSPGEVFVAPGGCMLVRADLFTSLGGFDSAMTLEGEDVDFSWRAHVVGARVVTAAAARVRHLAASSNGWRSSMGSADHDDEEANAREVFDELILKRRHRLRTVLKVQRRRWLVFTLLQLVILSVGEAVYGVVAGKAHHAGAVTAAWTWNFAHWRDVRKLRRQLQRYRTVDDRNIRAQLVPTRVRVEDLLVAAWERRRERRQLERQQRNPHDLAGRVRHLPIAAWATVVVIWLAGSRHLIKEPLPALGQFASRIPGPLHALKQFSGLLPTPEWGLAALQSPIYLLLAVLGMLFGGGVGMLQKVLVLGMLPIGVYGMCVLVRRLKSAQARLMAVVIYAAVPLPYDSLSTGHWDGLVAYAIAPFLLHRLLQSTGAAPWIDRTRIEFLRRRSPLLDDDDLEMLVLSESLLDEGETMVAPVTRMRAASALLAERDMAVAAAAIESVLTDRASWRDRLIYTALRRVVPLGLLMAVGALVAPQVLSAVIVVSIALGLGSLITNAAWREAARVICVAAGAAIVALLLIFPALFGSDHGWRDLLSAPVSASTPTGFGALLRAYAGGTVPEMASFGLLIAALPALLVGNAWRLTLSLRLWLATLVTVIITWAGVHSWLGAWHPDPHVFLAFAGVTVALNAAVGVVALQQDLKTHSFGWRQALPFVAVVGVVMCVLPIGSRAGSGTWDLPQISNTQLLSWMDASKAQGSFRVLWLGDDDSMPGPARRLAPDLGGAISVDGAKPNSIGLTGAGGQGQRMLADDIELARNGDTVELGRLLSKYSIRYVVVPNRTGPQSGTSRSVFVPPDLQNALSSQLDLGLLNTDASVSVYQNVDYIPVRAALDPEQVLAAHSASTNPGLSADLTTAISVLPDGTGRTWVGGLDAGEVFVAEDNNPAWRLKVGGHEMEHRSAFGWANSFSVGASGRGELHFVPSLWLPIVQCLNAVLWFAALVVTVRFRARRGRWT